MQDGFELVKKKRQRKQKINYNLREESEFEEIFFRKLNTASEELKSSQFYFELIQKLTNCLTNIGSDTITELLCYGIGNFTESKSSLHQLAAVINISKKFNSSVVVYDPVFTSFETKTLKELNFKIPPENEEGKRKISKTHTTLVFLPHCPKQLTNNFLWANWNTSLSRCVIIGNSFSKIIQDNTQKVLQESASYFVRIYPHTEEVTLNDCYHIDNIFNDTAIHYFKSEDLTADFFAETLAEEPNYLKDTEFITKAIGGLDIKNE